MRQISDQELRELFKKIEDDLNLMLFEQTNSLSFVKLMNALMELHLNLLVEIRRITKEWLDSMDLPDRDDIANLAQKIIENESRFDRLEDSLYEMVEEIAENRKYIVMIALEIAELSEE